ncbi:MAG TPA: hypothetical protein VJJ75_00945 [Candidatus Nanoarchaeia archaeon]|nr:hypothetical protein [Candidatus Nanoarchaeia archaeon]
MRTLRSTLKALEGTLESLIKDKDLKKVEAVTVLKAAEASKEFQEHAKNEPGKHHVIGVRIGNEEFRLDEQQRFQQDPAQFFEETQTDSLDKQQTQIGSFSSGKYEGNINTAVFDCTCGKVHEGFTPQQAHEAAAFERFATEYGANIAKDAKEKGDDGKYNPMPQSDKGDSAYLSGIAPAEGSSFGSSEYLLGGSDTSSGYEASGKQKKSLYHS